MLNDAMKALTTRKPISLTTTSLCSGAFTARIARTQRLYALRLAGVASPAWERIVGPAGSTLFKGYALSIEAATVSDDAAALAALAGGEVDAVFTGVVAALQAGERGVPLQFLAVAADPAYAYVALAATVEARRYPLARFTRALRENTGAGYVNAADLQSRIDELTAERALAHSLAAGDLISRVAVMSGTR